MRNQPLLKLLQDFRFEVRASNNPAHNAAVRDEQAALLARVQEGLYEDHDWAHLRVERYIDVQAGQRYYLPPADIAIDRVEKLDFRFGDRWEPMTYGIEDGHLNARNSDSGERAWPVERWEVHEGDKIELWPVPSDDGDRYVKPDATTSEGRIRVTGIRNLRPLIADDDLADLDDRLLVLTAATEFLAARGSKDAAVKERAAVKRLQSLRGNMSKTKQWTLYGSSPDRARRPSPPPAVHYRDRETR